MVQRPEIQAVDSTLTKSRTKIVRPRQMQGEHLKKSSIYLGQKRSTKGSRRAVPPRDKATGEKPPANVTRSGESRELAV